MKRFFLPARRGAPVALLIFAASTLASCDAAPSATTNDNVASTRSAATNVNVTTARDENEPGHHHESGEGLGLHADTTKMAFSTQPPELKVGEKARWTLKITDRKSGQPVPNFIKMHDKLLHLIVASDDLSFFVHIHPHYVGNGTFVLDYAMPRAGKFHVYADYVTDKNKHEVSRHEIVVAGANALPDTPQLVADKISGGWIVKKFGAHVEGELPPANATRYQVALMPMPAQLHAGEEAMLHFQVRDANGKPLTDLQPYMGAMGHAVILSEDGAIYLHTHPVSDEMAEMMGGDSHQNHAHGDAMHGMKMDGAKNSAMNGMKMNGAPSDAMNGMKMGGAHGDDDMAAMMKSLPASTRGGPNVVFHATFPAAGLYRVWGQFMRDGKVITAAFTLRVLAAAPGA